MLNRGNMEALNAVQFARPALETPLNPRCRRPIKVFAFRKKRSPRRSQVVFQDLIRVLQDPSANFPFPAPGQVTCVDRDRPFEV